MSKPVTIPNAFAAQTGNIPLSQLDSNFTTVQTALNDPATYTTYAADSGAANAYVITLNPAPSSLASLVGVPIYFKPTNANTTASTINVNALGVVNILRQSGSALSANDINAGSIVGIAYDGTQFRLISQQTSGSASGCRVHNSTGLTVNTIPTALTFNTEDWDDANYHSTVSNTSRLTAPATGRYQVVASVASSSNNVTSCAIRKNGTTYLADSHGSSNVSAPFTSASVCTFVGLLNATDYVELMVVLSSGSNTTDTTATWFSITQM